MSRLRLLPLCGFVVGLTVGVCGAASSAGAVEEQVRAMPPWTVAPETDRSVIDHGAVDHGMLVHQPPRVSVRPWMWQILPEGLLYRSYLAGSREPRIAIHWIHEQNRHWLWDATLGGRAGLLRFGDHDPIRPEGWQLDVEGAAFPRMSIEDHRDMVSVDFRFGFPLTFRRGPWEAKFGFYHLSSHLGDEYMLTHPWIERINFSRDTLVLGVAFCPNEDLRLYAETGWAWYTNGGSEPWEFQFGIDYSPAQPWGILGEPFFAINTRLREEVDFGGNMTVQAGRQWRGHTGQLFRVGMQYFHGQSDQYQFFQEHEEQIGIGIWYDY